MDHGTTEIPWVLDVRVETLVGRKIFEFLEILPELGTVGEFRNGRVGKFVEKDMHHLVRASIHAQTYFRTLVGIETEKPVMHSVVPCDEDGFHDGLEFVILGEFLQFLPKFFIPLPKLNHVSRFPRHTRHKGSEQNPHDDIKYVLLFHLTIKG